MAIWVEYKMPCNAMAVSSLFIYKGHSITTCGQEEVSRQPVESPRLVMGRYEARPCKDYMT